MGFGSSPFGIGLFGADVVTASSTRLTVPPQAAMYDLKTKAFPLDEDDGTIVSVHPIDQIVALRVSMPLGTIKSLPTLGHEFAKLSRLAPDKVQPAAERLVTAMYADLVKRGDITILGVRTATPVRGNNQVGIDYVNNRTTQRRKVSNG